MRSSVVFEYLVDYILDTTLRLAQRRQFIGRDIYELDHDHSWSIAGALISSSFGVGRKHLNHDVGLLALNSDC